MTFLARVRRFLAWWFRDTGGMTGTQFDAGVDLEEDR